MNFKYLVFGSGLFGSTFAYEAAKRGHNVTVIEKKSHIGANIYTKNIDGINVHMYGAHIFHTSMKNIWDYVNQFAEFNNYINSPIANYNGEIYNLPFNMNTFNKLWGVKTPKEAQNKIDEQRKSLNLPTTPTNLEEQALSLAETDIYNKLIKGYTEKQWGRKAS
ncbi:UDP-galactopyranose mutase [Apilactobacillus kunkeei]|nr:UDP-galactopyranose mutase [Apilactobacillus kunkeei]CAI2648518.1 UDP-galactopyranose mutase [Apilactobacillus kunkeei]CAI2803178.1 UDP-galactopyranose mutase [Apilactobacillus kunkeei]